MLEESDDDQRKSVEDNLVARRGERIRQARKLCNDGQERTVKKMLQMNKKQIKNVKLNDLVLLSLPDVDRGPLDPTNLLCYVLEEKHSLFKLGCRAGVLDKFFAFNSFEKTNLLSDFNITDIPKVKDKKGNPTDQYLVVCVSEAVKLLSVGNDQGFVKYSCSGQCATKKCSCKAANIPCSSKCHGKAFTCKNS